MPNILHIKHLHTVRAYQFSHYGSAHKYIPGDKRSQQNAYKRAQNDMKYWQHKQVKPQRGLFPRLLVTLKEIV